MTLDRIKNIIIVNDFGYVQGGASKVAIDTVNLLSQYDYNVYFFTGKIQTKKESRGISEKVKVIATNQPEALQDNNRLRGFKNGLYNKKAYIELSTLLSKLNPRETIVHIHGWTKVLSSSIFKACFDFNFITVLTLHDYFAACPNGGFFNYQTNQICPLRAMGEECFKTDCDSRNYFFKLYRLWRQKIQNDIGVLSKVKNIIYISDLQWSILKPYFTNVKNAQKILNPIDAENKKRYKKHPNGPFVYIGRLSKEKGIVEFCEGVTLAKVPATVAGDGPLLGLLRQNYPNIQFLGWQNHDSILSLMEQAKCLIFPSLWYEGEPLAPIEADTIGLPCILSDKNSAKEFIKTSYIYNGNSVEDLYHIIQKFNNEYENIKINKHVKSPNYVKDITKFYNKSLL